LQRRTRIAEYETGESGSDGTTVSAMHFCLRTTTKAMQIQVAEFCETKLLRAVRYMREKGAEANRLLSRKQFGMPNQDKRERRANAIVHCGRPVESPN
jgi:hypothetical protein